MFRYGGTEGGIGLWISVQNNSASPKERRIKSVDFSFLEGTFGVYPPPPVISGIIGLARNSLQNTSVKELRGQNPLNKGLR
jgi:hypothetical protein